MTVTEPPEFSPDWLRLREGADAAARAGELLDPLRTALAGAPRLVIHDLGCGTGSMGRWLTPQMTGPQHWVLYDRDPELLRHAAASMPAAAADGAPVTVEVRHADLARLGTGDLAGADLVTASALLDLFTADEVDRLAGSCLAAGCPVLFTLSVVGEVTIDPAEPLDADLAAAFNDHQRRTSAGRRLLGPDAADAAAAAFARRGATVQVCPSPWRLGADEAALATEWLRGWVDAAVQQRPQLAGPAPDYLARRLASAAAGELRVVVQHRDLLAQPR